MTHVHEVFHLFLFHTGLELALLGSGKAVLGHQMLFLPIRSPEGVS